VDGDVGHAELQRLKIRVDGHELNPGNPSLNHPVHGIDAAAAHADDPNNRLMRLPTTGRLILRLLPPVPRGFHNRLELTTPIAVTGLLGENPFEPLRRCLLRAF
jgi:hypothetical protein